MLEDHLDCDPCWKRNRNASAESTERKFKRDICSSFFQSLSVSQAPRGLSSLSLCQWAAQIGTPRGYAIYLLGSYGPCVSARASRNGAAALALDSGTRGAREKVMASGPWKLAFNGAPPSVAGRSPPFPLPMLRLSRLSLRPWLALHLLLFLHLLRWPRGTNCQLQRS
jgi:hypothetical protein